MSNSDVEHVRTGLENFQIDDSKVNKMIRRRSSRIQERMQRLSVHNLSFEFENNNWILVERDKNQANKSSNTATETELMLEYENVHYQQAIKQFTFIRQSEYKVRRTKNKFDNDGDDCGCTLNPKQIQLGESGCGPKCLNREMFIECDRSCKLGKFCSNQRFQNFEYAECTVFITEKKGFGLFASKNIPTNIFIMEFVGEVVSMTEFKKRSRQYAKQKTRHCYVMTSSGTILIDATKKGNLTRFANHSCNPNAETQKWIVNGESRIGIFSKKPIKMFEEITINYQFKRFG